MTGVGHDRPARELCKFRLSRSGPISRNDDSIGPGPLNHWCAGAPQRERILPENFACRVFQHWVTDGSSPRRPIGSAHRWSGPSGAGHAPFRSFSPPPAARLRRRPARQSKGCIGRVFDIYCDTRRFSYRMCLEKMGEAQRQAIKWRWADPSQRERQSAFAKAQWADPAQREKMIAAQANPTVREKMAAATKASWADPVSRQVRTERIKAGHRTSASREEVSAASRERWADPVMREKIMTGLRAARDRRRGSGV